MAAWLRVAMQIAAALLILAAWKCLGSFTAVLFAFASLCLMAALIIGTRRGRKKTRR
jgi:hypothetical protein